MAPRRPRATRPDRGQSTVEFALLLPLLVVAALLVVQLGLLARDQVLVTHAAREGVRASALDDDSAAVEKAVRDAGPLDPTRLGVRISGRHGPGSHVTVRVTYTDKPEVPLLGTLLPTVTFHGTATMRVER